MDLRRFCGCASVAMNEEILFMAPIAGSLVTESLDYDGGRQVYLVRSCGRA
jgi:hypothetical protein